MRDKLPLSILSRLSADFGKEASSRISRLSLHSVWAANLLSWPPKRPRPRSEPLAAPSGWTDEAQSCEDLAQGPWQSFCWSHRPSSVPRLPAHGGSAPRYAISQAPANDHALPRPERPRARLRQRTTASLKSRAAQDSPQPLLSSRARQTGHRLRSRP